MANPGKCDSKSWPASWACTHPFIHVEIIYCSIRYWSRVQAPNHTARVAIRALPFSSWVIFIELAVSIHTGGQWYEGLKYSIIYLSVVVVSLFCFVLFAWVILLFFAEGFRPQCSTEFWSYKLYLCKFHVAFCFQTSCLQLPQGSLSSSLEVIPVFCVETAWGQMWGSEYVKWRSSRLEMERI